MKQSIVEAAYDYATEKTKFRKEVLKEVYADNYVPRHADCMEDFQCGADWQAKQSPWISIKDKEPLTNKPILVILEGRPVIMVLCGWDSRLGHHPNVTHWMPIPKFNE